MSETTWTPGPQHVTEMDHGLYVTGGPDGDPLVLADLSQSDAMDPHADARLYAAASALYDALTDALEDGAHANWCQTGPCECWRKDAKVALRRATGQEA